MTKKNLIVEELVKKQAYSNLKVPNYNKIKFENQLFGGTLKI